jgi:hypothetical protein
MASQPATPTGSGPPYPPAAAVVGGRPTTAVDVPISSVLLALFLIGAIFNMAVFQINRRRDHKFLLSFLLFALCMARAVALIMRIVWAERPTNVNIAIAANVFTSAGVLILFIVNLILAGRLLRAYQPRIGWNGAVRLSFKFLYLSVVGLLIMVVAPSVYGFFTLDPTARRQIRDVQRFAVTYLAVLAFLPIPIVLFAMLWPRAQPAEKFGHGRLRTKAALVLFTSTLLALGAGFRAGAAFEVRPASQPAWFHHRAAYYCFNFVVELVVVYAYGLMRFDRRFHVPDGSSGPGHYNGTAKRTSTFSDRINTEADAFGLSSGQEQRQQRQHDGEAREWDERAKTELEMQDRGEAVPV